MVAMTVRDSKGRGVEIVVRGDHKSRAVIGEASYIATGDNVDSSEIEFITDTYAEEMSTAYAEYDRAEWEAWFDSKQDR